jgi:calcineurin-like phosphoesterase family protein
MNRDLLARINSRVQPDDRLIVHGDWGLGPIHDALALVRRINCPTILQPGNHDRCFPGRKDHAKWRRAYLDAGFADVLFTTASVRIGDHDVITSHVPPRGDSHDADRFFGWRPAEEDERWVVHGHVHTAWRVSGRWINVGVDAWNGYPLSEHELAALMDAGEQHLPPLPWTWNAMPAVSA